ncbi:GNAT family N-acetyltransferase [Roseovarius pacificus]|uniref:GNAT family N-acetyltransferase n=1 Tax=Roseovarius pacificus TaxID=337701 RepID=UPI002A188B06|nr:GNAT family N-acetyltransferase [Roseovarius pacificus]
MITYQQEFLCQTDKAEVMPLLREDWDEIEHPSKRGCDLDPDWDTYEALEGQGAFKVFTAREDGELIGYLGVFIAPFLHSKGKLLAMMDAIYVRKDRRNSRAGVGLIRFTERCMREDGLTSLCLTSTESYPLGHLFARLGYSPVETRHEKAL